MSKRKLKDKLISLNDINEEIKKIEIGVNSYITKTGRVFVDYGENQYLELKQQTVYGYKYVGILIKKTRKRTSKRVHRLVAEAFIPNPNHYPVVGHKDNDKSNNNVDNLYWTTIQENTQKAYDDKLAKNKKSWEDSQSVPVCQFDLEGNFIQQFGSIGECSRQTTMTKTGIIHQCEHRCNVKPRKGFYYRYLKEFQDKGFIL